MKTQKTHSEITKIKDSAKIWMDETSQIQQLVAHDFTTRFKSSHTNAPNIEIELPKMVLEADNDILLKPIQD